MNGSFGPEVSTRNERVNVKMGSKPTLIGIHGSTLGLCMLKANGPKTVVSVQKGGIQCFGRPRHQKWLAFRM
jgi:hypothetical protein